MHHEDVKFVWKVCDSFLFLKQNNPEEKAYFWLGKGEMEGTISELLKAALGDYWGELEMTNYSSNSSNSSYVATKTILVFIRIEWSSTVVQNLVV